ncbi:hypothetical protein EST38_g13590 [Candolleomyces aberdarensis]|uniref:Uncharacterized protein n=1 Tax=Candolleomyces aberdarensis TaxID=2316362 RepID=A0A4Q2D1V1_9AGAR|nr:hypothetical protein EST38_g13590 [Candolleomyces aberdarensis]
MPSGYDEDIQTGNMGQRVSQESDNDETNVDSYDSDVDEEECFNYIELQLEALCEGHGGMGSDDNIGDDELDSEVSTMELDEPPAIWPTSGAIPQPAVLKTLREALKGGYTCPPFPPLDSDEVRDNFKNLTRSKVYSLRHFIIWKKTGGTVLAYQLHAKLLESIMGTEILSIYLVRKLAAQLTKFSPVQVSMCPRSCIAYTGEYKDLDKCPYMIPASKKQKKEICGRARVRTLPSGKKILAAYFQVLSLWKKIEALFANKETARLLRYRDNCLKETLRILSIATSNATPHTTQQTYSDFPNSQIHCMQHEKLGLFQDPWDVAFALSTDGAQLTMKKLSNTWVLILILFNFPPEMRYKSSNIMVNFAIPGPDSPGDIESFLYPLFEEFAQASEGFWMWDAVDSAMFINRFYPVLGNGDMLGSAKINGMAGHTAFYGDRFSMVPAARNRLQGNNAKALYYPISPP